eukprot:6476159-Amphidinium_carterae.1
MVFFPFRIFVHVAFRLLVTFHATVFSPCTRKRNCPTRRHEGVPFRRWSLGLDSLPAIHSCAVLSTMLATSCNCLPFVASGITKSPVGKHGIVPCGMTSVLFIRGGGTTGNVHVSYDLKCWQSEDEKAEWDLDRVACCLDIGNNKRFTFGNWVRQQWQHLTQTWEDLSLEVRSNFRPARKWTALQGEGYTDVNLRDCASVSTCGLLGFLLHCTMEHLSEVARPACDGSCVAEWAPRESEGKRDAAVVGCCDHIRR